MRWRTCFSSISYFGHKLDILKSGIQKYFRRREERKMLWCLGEIYLFKVLAQTPQEHQAAKGIISNLLNRIVVMLDEEMLFCEWGKYLLVRKLMDGFEAGGREDFISLIKVCKIMCGARLLRRNSDIRGYFGYGMSRKGVAKPAELVEKTKEMSADEHNFKNFVAYFDKSKSSDEQEFQKSFDCFYWESRMYAAKRVGTVARFRRKDNIYMIWEFLFHKAFGNPYLRRCLDYRLKEFNNKARRERHMFLTAAIDLCLHADRIDWNPKYISCDIEVSEDNIKEIFSGRKNLEIDDYVIDMHCSKGRKMGKNGKDFVSSGAVVAGEDKEYLVKKWRNVYNNKHRRGGAESAQDKDKTADSSPAGEKAAREANAKMVRKARSKPRYRDLEVRLEYIDFGDFADVQPCLKNTCCNKAMCLFATHQGRDVVLKEGRKSMNYNRDYEVVDNLKSAFGLHKIGMRRIRSNKRAEKVDKKKKSWVDNWQLVDNTGDEDVVYCLMDRVKNAVELQSRKSQLLTDRKLLKEYVKIGVFRGIFRVSDFHPKNVLIDGDGELVSIDEGDIGKRVEIIGQRNKEWVSACIDDQLIGEILSDINTRKQQKKEQIVKTMRGAGFRAQMIQLVLENYNNLRVDLTVEGLLSSVL